MTKIRFVLVSILDDALSIKKMFASDPLAAHQVFARRLSFFEYSIGRALQRRLEYGNTLIQKGWWDLGHVIRLTQALTKCHHLLYQIWVFSTRLVYIGIRKPDVQLLDVALHPFLENYRSIDDFRFPYGLSFLCLIIIGFAHGLKDRFLVYIWYHPFWREFMKLPRTYFASGVSPANRTLISTRH